MSMIQQSYKDINLLRFERLAAEARLVHAVTTREQNFAPHRGPDRTEAIHWRQEVCRLLGVPFDTLTSPAQVHGCDVLAIEEGDIGCGRNGRESALKFVDGLITDRPGVPIILLSADCPLICAFDPDRPAIGAVHASWRGTINRAAENMIYQMVSHFGCDPDRLLAAIAPSVGPCCYQVGSEVRRVARTRLDDADKFFIEKGDRLLFDLWSANQWQLINAGLSAENIEIARLCTICDHRFWSHRRDGPNTGRFALFIAVKEKGDILEWHEANVLQCPCAYDTIASVC